MIAKGWILGLRTCQPDGRPFSDKAPSDFRWPMRGYVEAADWRPDGDCGGGLHFLPWGEGDASLLNDLDDSRWQVILCRESDIVEITNPAGKSKARCCWVVYSGGRSGACDFIRIRHSSPSMYAGQATASGYAGQATASGTRGQATASGDAGQATASGTRGQATASGYAGQATASGDDGLALASYAATAATRGVIVIRWHDGTRFRCAVGYVGEKGILPGVAYRCDAGKLVPVDAKQAEAVKARLDDEKKAARKARKVRV